MATAIEVSDQQLQSELQDQQKQLGRLQEKLNAERRRLDTATAERSRVVDAIERGETGKQSDLSRAKDAVEEVEIRIGGLQKNIVPIEARILELKQESDRRQVAAAKAAFEKEYAELQEKGAAVASRILGQLKKLTEDLAEFDAVRVKLETRFARLGGNNAAFALRRLLFDERRVPKEAHIAALQQDGWEVSGGPKLTGPLELTVRSMTRTAAESLRERTERTVR